MASPNLMRVFTAVGVRDLDVADWRERSLVGEHWNAIKQFLATGDTSLLWPFDSLGVAGMPLGTSARQIEDWALQGELVFEDIYTS